MTIVLSSSAKGKGKDRDGRWRIIGFKGEKKKSEKMGERGVRELRKRICGPATKSRSDKQDENNNDRERVTFF